MATEGTVVSVALTQISSQRLGYHAITLTNLFDTTEPAVAAGSKIEIGGALYGFSGTTSIGNWTSIGTDSSCFVYAEPGGTAVTIAFAATAPSWDDAKQGYYSGDDRAFGAVYKTSAAGYGWKAVYVPGGRNRLVGNLPYLHGNFTVTEEMLYNQYAPSVPEVGDRVPLTGQGRTAADSSIHDTFSFVERASAAALTIYVAQVQTGSVEVFAPATVTIEDGSSAATWDRISVTIGR